MSSNHIKSILPHSYVEKCVAIISINVFLSFCTAYERRVVEFGLLPEIKEKNFIIPYWKAYCNFATKSLVMRRKKSKKDRTGTIWNWIHRGVCYGRKATYHPTLNYRGYCNLKFVFFWKKKSHCITVMEERFSRVWLIYTE